MSGATFHDGSDPMVVHLKFCSSWSDWIHDSEESLEVTQNITKNVHLNDKIRGEIIIRLKVTYK